MTVHNAVRSALWEPLIVVPLSVLRRNFVHFALNENYDIGL
jgi:hypothetical protein